MNRAKAKQIGIDQARKIARITICKVDGFEFALVSSPLVARPRKLRALWTLESDQEMERLQSP
ncbi:MAG: hypothetical protein ACOYB3_01480 [Azonexus sp.]